MEKGENSTTSTSSNVNVNQNDNSSSPSQKPSEKSFEVIAAAAHESPISTSAKIHSSGQRSRIGHLSPSRFSQESNKDKIDTSANSMMMEELVMKRRLLIDGANNDKRLANLTKSFVSFCNSTDQPSADSDVSLAGLMVQLKQVEFDAQKNYDEIKETEEARAMYNAVQKDVQDGIEKTKKLIFEASTTLMQSKRNHAGMKEAEYLTGYLSQQPARNAVTAKIDKFKGQLNVLKKTREKQQKRLDKRIGILNNFAGFVDNLEEVLKEDNEELATEGSDSTLEIKQDVPTSSQSFSNDTSTLMVASSDKTGEEIKEQVVTHATFTSLLEHKKSTKSGRHGLYSISEGSNSEISEDELPDNDYYMMGLVNDKLMDEVTLMGFVENDIDLGQLVVKQELFEDKDQGMPPVSVSSGSFSSKSPEEGKQV